MVNKEDYIAQRHVNSDMTGIHFDIDRRVSPNTIRNISCGLTQDEAEFIVSACNACKSINEEHPELVAQNIKDMYEVLKALDSVNSYWWQEVDGDILKRMNKVLSKIKGGE